MLHKSSQTFYSFAPVRKICLSISVNEIGGWKFEICFFPYFLFFGVQVIFRLPSAPDSDGIRDSSIYQVCVCVCVCAPVYLHGVNTQWGERGASRGGGGGGG
jgi:hypothetical protein